MRLCTALLLSVFALLAPRPGSAWALLHQPLDAGPAAIAVPLVALSTLLGWLLLLWLAVVSAALLASRVPGALGALAAALAARLAPVVVRRGLAMALGLGLAAGTPTAWAADSDAGAWPPLDWPVATAPDRPALLAPAPGPRPATARPAPSARTYVVVPGDALWTIAAAHLGPRATPTQVAAAWPAWWQANRSQIGADPDLIRPGTRLTPPASPPPEKE